MRLSEAILLGSTTTKQCFGKLAVLDPDGGDETCAIGSALHAIGQLQHKDDAYASKVLIAEWPWVMAFQPTIIKCPACSLMSDVFYSGVIIHLNDLHLWTREQIAEWVETVDPTPMECAPHRHEDEEEPAEVRVDA